ncbi:MAG: hypothetical protein ACKVJK_17060 [Methylophagaceae bacterium]
MAVGSGKIYEFNRLEGGGMVTAIQGCNMTTEYDVNASNDPRTTFGVYYAIHAGAQSIANIDTDTVFYTDTAVTVVFDGEDEWYGVRESGSADDVEAEIVVQINASGEVSTIFTCALLGSFSVTGSIPYVDYYAGSFTMFESGAIEAGSASEGGIKRTAANRGDYTSIEGAVSESCFDFGIVFSGSNFNEFISQSIPEGFDETITGGVITDPSTEISSSLQFQGYPQTSFTGSGMGTE